MTVPTPADALDRHQELRAMGLPTLSVLSGAVGVAAREGRRWAEGRGRRVVAVDDPRLGAMAAAWADGLADGRDLPAVAVAWLARRLDCPASELGPRIARKTPFERAAFLDAALPDPSDAGAICRFFLSRPPVEATGLAARLGAALAGRDGDAPAERVVAALHDLVPPGSGPVLLASPRTAGPDGASWVETAAASLARLAEAQPRLTPILAIDPAALDAYRAHAPESRAKAMVRAGLIAVPALDGDAIGRRLDAAVPGARRGSPGRSGALEADGASEELVRLFLDAATAPEGDAARSAAERFLFARLDSLAATAGLFELNATLDFAFGPSRMEVDLASRALKLAIEIDGYHHFQDADAYRRDRRKDVALQSRGYLVVRVLAVDVVSRLESILITILDAVAQRRGLIDPERGNGP